MPYNSHLNVYSVRLALYGVKKRVDPNAIPDLEDELKARSHIMSFSISWESEFQPIEIIVEVEGKNERITEQMAEEIFEVACAVLNDVEGMHVKVIEVSQNK